MDRSVAPRNETKNATARRKELVDKAALLFDRNGYHDTSMDDLATEVGLAKPSLYHYVSGKADILSQIHEEFIEQLISRQSERDARAMSAAEQLKEIMSDILELMETHRGHVRVFFEHHRDLPTATRRAVRDRRDHYERSVVQVIERGIDDGEFRATDARLVALTMFGMCNWAYQWYSPKGSLTTHQIAEFMWGVLVNGISATSDQD